MFREHSGVASHHAVYPLYSRGVHDGSTSHTIDVHSSPLFYFRAPHAMSGRGDFPVNASQASFYTSVPHIDFGDTIVYTYDSSTEGNFLA